MTLFQAANLWASMPPRARREVIAFFVAEAAQSDEWAKEPMGDASGEQHAEDAKAFRAAVRLLRAAGRRAR